ncbi:MAG TPA: hypothetical protein VN041_09250 [Microbacterium sp.]|nr:hypothetical protein [Microbacterium sp.]
MADRWQDVADIIGAYDAGMDAEDLGEAGQAWARQRFGGEARYLVKVFDYLMAAREVGSSDA